MSTPTHSARANNFAQGATGLAAVVESVAKLNALLGSETIVVDNSSNSGADDADARRPIVQRMGMRIGDLGLLFAVNAGREVVAPPAVSRIPNTAPWLRGLANVRGTLVPVIDAAAVLGVVRTVGMPAYLLIFGQGEGAIGLTIDGLPRLLEIDAAKVLADPPTVPSPLAAGIRAAYAHHGQIWFDVDLDAWFDTLAREVGPLAGARSATDKPTTFN